MPRAHPPIVSRETSPPSPRQLWHAAQRLAAGDGPAQAAVQAGIAPSVLRALIEARDADLEELVAACGSVHELTPAARAERLIGSVLDAAERELASGNATVIGAVVRASGCLARRAAAESDDAGSRYWRMLMTITPDELVALQKGERFVDVASDPRFQHDPLFVAARGP